RHGGEESLASVPGDDDDPDAVVPARVVHVPVVMPGTGAVLTLNRGSQSVGAARPVTRYKLRHLHD
ncbi:MAG: hypothetical protein KY439_10160, partial [Actinobacteria bacterium]|nr:hypothetical protein [Actinomycetota bacterium]